MRELMGLLGFGPCPALFDAEVSVTVHSPAASAAATWVWAGAGRIGRPAPRRQPAALIANGAGWPDTDTAAGPGCWAGFARPTALIPPLLVHHCPPRSRCSRRSTQPDLPALQRRRARRAARRRVRHEAGARPTRIID